MRALFITPKEYLSFRDLLALMIHNMMRTNQARECWHEHHFYLEGKGDELAIKHGRKLRRSKAEAGIDLTERFVDWDDYQNRWPLDNNKTSLDWKLPEGWSVDYLGELLVAELVIALVPSQGVWFSRYERKSKGPTGQTCPAVVYIPEKKEHHIY